MADSAPKTEAQHFLLDEVLVVRRSGVYARLHKGQYPKNTSLWVRLSGSTFPSGFPRLYGSLLELRSFYHHIRLVCRRGHTRRLEMGHTFQLTSLGCLVRNTRTQARSTDMRTLLSDLPWLSPENLHLFLAGWDAGSGYREDADTARSSDDSQAAECSIDTSVTDNATPPIVTQQSTTHDPSGPLPSRE
jgi:hypothetical protein